MNRRHLVTAAVAVPAAAVLAACTDDTPGPAGPGPTTEAPPPSPRPATKLGFGAILPAGPTAAAPVEIAVETDGVWANPFDPSEVDITVVVSGPGGQKLTVPAFWYQAFTADGASPDGAPGWRVRFTPAVPGTWTVTATLAEPALRAAPTTVAVGPATAADARGFVRVDKAGTGFAYDDGSGFIPVGPNICWSRGPDVLGDYRRWFDRLAAAGGNATRVWMASWSFGLEWKDTGLGDYRKRLRQAWLLDQVFALARQHGIRLMLVLSNHGQFSTTTNPEWNDNPYNKANGGPLADPIGFATDPTAVGYFTRRLRYIAARWAGEPGLWAWEWWNEVNFTPIGQDSVLGPWIQKMTPVLRGFDPYRRPITNSLGDSGSSDTWALPELDFACSHVYSIMDATSNFADRYTGTRARAARKPIVLAEYGYSGGADDRNLDPEGIHWHNGMWAASLTGFAGPAMYWFWDDYIDPANLWGQVHGPAAFLAGEKLAGFTPVKPQAGTGAVALALVSPRRALGWVRAGAYARDDAKAAYEKAITKANKDKVTLKYVYQPPTVTGAQLVLSGLTDGAWRVTWWSTMDGKPTGAGVTVTAAGGKATIAVPSFTRDIAFKAER